jgi:hypothetical protein
MALMFYGSKFTGENGSINNWNVISVEDMSHMFEESEFNGNISNWDVIKVNKMDNMFMKSKFNHDISKWNVSNVKSMKNIFKQCPIEEKYKPNFK